MNIIEVYQRFSTQEACLDHLEQVRWKNRPICPYCKSNNSTALPNERRHHCNNCNTSYSVTVGTIFHKTHLDLQKWFLAISLILNAKKGISARQIARDIKVNKNTAWYLAMRIRRAMSEQGQKALLEGIIEMDETYIGGKPRKGGDGNAPNKRGRGTKKTPVVGLMEREGKVRAGARLDRILTAKKLASIAKFHVNPQSSVVITDEFPAYNKIASAFNHLTIDHRFSYAFGPIHTNSIESFWALLKRGIYGQYHAVSKKHLNKYINEFCYRHNNRKNGNIFEDTIERGLRVIK
jgi:transposase-like protein